MARAVKPPRRWSSGRSTWVNLAQTNVEQHEQQLRVMRYQLQRRQAEKVAGRIPEVKELLESAKERLSTRTEKVPLSFIPTVIVKTSRLRYSRKVFDRHHQLDGLMLITFLSNVSMP